MIFSSFSRLKDSPLTIINDKETVGVWKRPGFLSANIPETAIYTYVVGPQVAGRPDLISYYVYGTPYLDWVIISYNNVRDTLNWPPAGLTIKYPPKSYVVTGG